MCTELCLSWDDQTGASLILHFAAALDECIQSRRLALYLMIADQPPLQNMYNTAWYMHIQSAWIYREWDTGDRVMGYGGKQVPSLLVERCKHSPVLRRTLDKVHDDHKGSDSIHSHNSGESVSVSLSLIHSFSMRSCSIYWSTVRTTRSDFVQHHRIRHEMRSLAMQPLEWWKTWCDLYLFSSQVDSYHSDDFIPWNQDKCRVQLLQSCATLRHSDNQSQNRNPSE